MNSTIENMPLVNVTKHGNSEVNKSWICQWTPIELLVILHVCACGALLSVQNYYVIDETAKRHGQTHIILHAEKSCNLTTLNNVTHYNDTSDVIQKEAADIIMKLELCLTVGSVIPIFICGYLSDVFGRKQMFIISGIGIIIKEVTLLLTIRLQLPLWSLYVGQVIFAISGKYRGTMVQIYATVSDITTPGKNRAFRMTVVQATGMLTAAVTDFVIGIWLRHENFIEPVIISICFSTFAVVSSPLILGISTMSVSQSPLLSLPMNWFCRDTPQDRKRTLLMCLFVYLLSSFSLTGKLEYQVLFLMHEPICWNEFEIQVLHAVQDVANTFCVVGIVRLVLHFGNDAIILIFSSVSGIISTLMLTFSVNSWMVYLHVLFGLVLIAVFPVIRAMMSRLVDQQEQGFVFACIAGLDELSGALSGFVCGKLYGWSVAWFPGLTFLVMSAIFVLAFFGSLILYKWYTITLDAREGDDI